MYKRQTLISAQGFNLKYVQEWLGHSTITVTANTYTHIDMQEKTIVAHSLQDKVFGGEQEKLLKSAAR